MWNKGVRPQTLIELSTHHLSIIYLEVELEERAGTHNTEML